MAFPWSSRTKPRDGFGNQTAPTSTPSAANVQYWGSDEIKLKTIFGKMIWELGLACFLPPRRRGKDQTGNNSEHNKALLLAESGGGDAADPHSSFRYSFCSQAEVESMNVANHSPATVLMVNLDNGLVDSRELKYRRIASLERAISPVAATMVRFSYAQILSATRNFSEGGFLGRGALSCVYRGRIGCLKTAVAIKRLVKEDEECWKSFCRELMIATSLHNPKIVPLLGFCIDPEEGLFLIYKYVSGGSLEKHLHEEMGSVKGVRSLPWNVRYKVAVGIAEAVNYLHNETDRCVIHRDIKPSNILLTSKKTPKVCDFGLATWTPAPSTPFLCKTVKGTFGYLAPEYFQHGKVSDKTDVYALGIVLLELITGRKPIEPKRGPGEENLVAWAKPLLQQRAIERLLDPRLKFSPRNPNQIGWMVQAAEACINSEESRRPDIAKIVVMLRGEEPNCSNSKKSSSRTGGGGVVDCESQSQQTRSEMKSHLALAMLGVSEFGDDDHLHCR